MKTPLAFILFIIFLLLVDYYFFQSFKIVASSGQRYKNWLSILYWSISVLSVAGFFFFFITDTHTLSRSFRIYFFSILIGVFLAKLLACFVFLIDDVRRIFQWTMIKLSQKAVVSNEEGISRSQFLSWMGVGLGATLFGSLLYGFSNKYNYQVRKLKVRFPNLPLPFKGLKIVQISDIHSGSLLDIQAVEKGLKKIHALKPDLILFTGDLVNDCATEMLPFQELFATLKAPLGVYSILGNHDYGDYVKWPIDGVTKTQNLENLKTLQKNMGWRLLMNEHVILEKDNQQIALIGIENWSNKARFPKYGKLMEAYKGTENISFKILMSHDPSHWDAEVRKGYKDIDLTLSGHTHGMQFGVEIPGMKWSPIQYVYPKWAGLYEEDGKKLYVNRGFGCLGYPGRVGVLPEITLIELDCQT
jgi:predicted MPP superfamily phosphohydrolase